MQGISQDGRAAGVPLCPFYARVIVAEADAFLLSGGNRCALIMDAHSPCLAVAGAGPAGWLDCVRNPQNNGTGSALLYERLAEKERR